MTTCAKRDWQQVTSWRGALGGVTARLAGCDSTNQSRGLPCASFISERTTPGYLDLLSARSCCDAGASALMWPERYRGLR